MKSLLSILLFLIATNSYSAIKTVINNSNNGWGHAANWSPSGVPVNGDEVIIPAGQTISVKGSFYGGTANIHIKVIGVLDFDPSGKLDLGSESIVSLITSTSQITTNGTSSELIIINGSTKYNGSIDGIVNGPKQASRFSGTSPSGFSESVLPVKIILFKAQPQNNKINISWETAEEINLRNFVIERSDDLQVWKSIKNVKAKGSASSYKISDEVPKIGLNYYRLRSFDIDNKTQTFKTVKVNYSISAEIRVGPNPASNTLYVSLPLASSLAYTVQIFDLNGRPINTTRGNATSGIIKVDLQNFNSGNYIVLVNNGNEVLVKKQIKFQK